MPSLLPPVPGIPTPSSNGHEVESQNLRPGGVDGPPSPVSAEPPDPPDPRRPRKPARFWGLVASMMIVATAAVLIGRGKSGDKNAVSPKPLAGDEIVRIEPADGSPWVLHFASGKTLAVQMTSRHGHFSWNTGPRIPGHTRVGEFRRGKGRMALVVSIDTEIPDHPSGELRIDYFDTSGYLETVFLEEEPAYGGRIYARNEWSLEALRYLDWDADQAEDVLVVATHTYFPSFLTIVCNAKREVTYFNAGHIKGLITLPGPVYASLQIAPRMASATGTIGVGDTGEPALVLAVEFNDRTRGAGLVVLPPRFRSGAYPADDTRYRHTTLPRLEDAHYMRFPPSLLALRVKAHQNWPGNIEPWNDADESFRVTTLETPNADGVMRRIGPGLAIQDIVFPDSALNNIEWEAWSAAERDSLAASLETVEVRRNGRWTKVRYPGTWTQRLEPSR